ncbi:nuclear mitotic apparatus protein 1-like [Falco naumanni]|uniref:nuclear mitotic apparatus protein 1-like n=1 Tax=Falco naumanni TaxID=148594 RepID=UPI001ADE438D|nr:nuclear mitotic apparatus protein 1-like [Falco naumanni]
MAAWCRLRRANHGFVVKPLYELLKASCSGCIAWTEGGNAAFTRLERALTEAPVLALPVLLIKTFDLFTHERESTALGVWHKFLGPQRHAVTDFSQQLDELSSGWPGCLQAAAATGLLIHEGQVTVCAPHFLMTVEELNKKLTQHEKAVQTQEQRVKVLEGELQAEATRQQEKVAELQAQLTQKEQAAKHYKEQMEKAKMCYDAVKQQNQDLAEKLKAMKQLQKENAELQMESERLAKELEQSILQVKESELSCQNLTSQVCSLEAQVGTAQQDSTPFLLLPFVAGSLRIHPFLLPIQVELANQQLQELGKFQGATDTLKGQETFCQNPADLSADSLDLSGGEQALNATRKAGCPQLEASVPPGNEESLASKQLPRKAESLESLHLAPRHSHRQLHLGTSAHSLGDLSLHSGDKTPPTLSFLSLSSSISFGSSWSAVCLLLSRTK